MTAPAALTLPQRLVLVKYLTERLAAVRKDDLLPQAASEMPSGSRLPVFFGARQAGWASMPQPSRKAAYVSDPVKLLAWTRAQYPSKVITDRTVRVTDEVLAVLAEHLPGAIVETPQPDPQWVADLLAALKGGGSYVTHEGEKLTGVPGITVPESDSPAPRVDLAGDAGDVIGAAWRNGIIAMVDLLALPAAGVPPVPAGLFTDEHGRFRSPEAAAAHAVMVQGGFSTPAREARRMLADAKRGGDEGQAQAAREWLESRGLTLDGDDEPHGRGGAG